MLAWVQAYGFERLSREEVNDPQYGGAIMHRLSKSYSEHCAEYRLRERAQRRGLPGAATRQLGEGHVLVFVKGDHLAAAADCETAGLEW